MTESLLIIRKQNWEDHGVAVSIYTGKTGNAKAQVRCKLKPLSLYFHKIGHYSGKCYILVIMQKNAV